MDTRIIDVVIGVALVFAITSLLATALQELWASMRSLRGEYLKKAVASFATWRSIRQATPGFASSPRKPSPRTG